jgi:hypothetical protein
MNGVALGMSVAVAEEERRMIAKRTKDGLVAAKARGADHSPPFGVRMPRAFSPAAISRSDVAPPQPGTSQASSRPLRPGTSGSPFLVTMQVSRMLERPTWPCASCRPRAPSPVRELADELPVAAVQVIQDGLAVNRCTLDINTRMAGRPKPA